MFAAMRRASSRVSYLSVLLAAISCTQSSRDAGSQRSARSTSNGCSCRRSFMIAGPPPATITTPARTIDKGIFDCDLATGERTPSEPIGRRLIVLQMNPR